MSDLDELIRMVFRDTCDGAPVLNPNGQFDMTSFDFPPNAFNLEVLPDASAFGLAGADLVPPEGTQEEADLMQMLEENGISVGLTAGFPYMDHNHDQSPSLIFPSGTTSAMTLSATDGNGYATQSAVDPEWLSRISPDYTRPAPQLLPPALTSSKSFAIANEAMPMPSIARRKRQAETDSTGWHTAKRGRWSDMSAVEGIPPSVQSGSSRLLGAYEDNEGIALELNNYTTRTFGGEDNFLAAGSVPVAVPSSAQGLWPTTTSNVAPATRTPFMTAKPSGQPFSLPIGTQPTVQQPAPILPWNTIPETHQLFGSMTYMPTEYGFDFAQPPFTTAEQSPHEKLLPWLSSAEMEDILLLPSMPCMPIENDLDASFAPVAAQPSDQAELTPQPSRYALRSRQPRRTRHTSPAEPQPQPFPVPVSAPTFGIESNPTEDRLPSVGIASETYGLSSSSMAPSTAKPQRRKQPPRASASSSSTAPSSAKAKNQKQPPRASGSKAPSTAKPKRQKISPPQTSDASSSSSTAPSTAKPQKRRRPPQTPYDPNGIGCHICKGGFTRQSEVTKHLKTNKHRLNEFALLYPELELCASQLKKNFACPECGKGMVRAWVLVRHLELKHGDIAKKVGVKTVDDAGAEAEVEGVDESDAETVDDADTDDDELD